MFRNGLDLKLNDSPVLHVIYPWKTFNEVIFLQPSRLVPSPCSDCSLVVLIGVVFSWVIGNASITH